MRKNRKKQKTLDNKPFNGLEFAPGERLGRNPSTKGVCNGVSLSLCEQFAKIENDKEFRKTNGAIIVGAGPSGMAVAACLRRLGISSIVLEREFCVASLWKHRTYERLKLHIGKKFCELPLMTFPEEYPMFVTRDQFLEYLEKYAKRFDIHPRLGQSVVSARFCVETKKWSVVAKSVLDLSHKIYSGRFLVVATGENSEIFVPDLPGVENFKGEVIHSSQYKRGEDFKGKKVLVVGCGNSGMEIALDLVNKDARPSIVVRSSAHVLPREVFGFSTFVVATYMLKLFPLRIVDYLLLLYSRLTLGDSEACGIPRPAQGPLELKAKTGKTPVLDVGTIAKIRSGEIKIFPNINRFMASDVEFENGRLENFEAIIFATGYRSGVLRWLKVVWQNGGDLFSDDGFPREPSPRNWKGEDGLYAVGLGRRGLLGSSMDAQLIAQDIHKTCSGES